MSEKKPPPAKAGQKPFLGDVELSNELDAWDEMFDGLHGGPEASAADEPVMAWPPPVAVELESKRPPEAEVELDEQLTLDRAADATTVDMPAAAPPTREGKITAQPASFTSDTADADPLETDFSDLGAQGAPSALGDFLGAAKRPTTNDGYDEVDDPATGVVPVRDSRPLLRGYTPVPVGEEDVEDVYTSASRPNVTPAPDDDLSIDEPAPPPRPSRPLPPAPPRRTGPAIIRRATPVAVPLANYAPQPAPVQEDSPFAENTRVADVGEMETHRADARSKAPTAPPPFAFTPQPHAESIDEDDYADIEIGADADQPEPTPPPADVPAPRRTAAH
ncbi:MAG: hypothetical protein ABI678_29470, partial [Kofleriaceae bacterium]